MRSTLALGGVAVLLSLLLLEGGLRLFFSAAAPVASHYPLGAGVAGSEIRFAQREYTVTLRYNGHGLRDDPFRPARAGGGSRVLFLGDSFVEGIGVEEPDRLSELLERGLGAPHVVLNAGQMGADPERYFRNLVDFGIALEPDLVVIGIYVGNDFVGGRAIRGLDGRVRTPLPPAPDLAGPVSLAYLRLGLRQLLVEDASPRLFRNLRGRPVWEVMYGAPIDRGFYRDFLGGLGIAPEEVDAAEARMDPELVADFHAGRLNPAYLIEAVARVTATLRGEPAYKRQGQVEEADLDGVLRLLRRARELLAERAIDLFVLVIPDVQQVHEAAHRAFLERLAVPPPPRSARLPELRRAFRDGLAAAGIRHLDLTPALRASRERSYHVMDGHWNEAGHRIAADALLRELAR